MARGRKKNDVGVSGSGTLPLIDKWDGSPESKARLHKGGQLVLRAVASELGLKKNEFDVHSNEAGVAIGGEIYLQTETFRMWIQGGYGREAWGKTPRDESDVVESYVIARPCKGLKDYVGDYERDVEIDWELLWDPARLVEVLRLEGIVS